MIRWQEFRSSQGTEEQYHLARGAKNEELVAIRCVMGTKGGKNKNLKGKKKHTHCTMVAEKQMTMRSKEQCNALSRREGD